MTKLFIAAVIAATMTTSVYAMDAAQAESDARACMAGAIVAAVVAKDPSMEAMAALMAPGYAYGPEGDEAMEGFKRRVAAGEVITKKDGSPAGPEMMNCFLKYRAAVTGE